MLSSFCIKRPIFATVLSILIVLAGFVAMRVLPLSLFMGAIFLMLADLLARTVVSPIELPIGVVTSLVGSVAFVVLFFRRRRLC